MFDNPRDYLSRLDEELRAEDSGDELDLDGLDRLLGEEPGEEDWLLEAKALLGDPEPQSPPVRRSQPRPMEEARHPSQVRRSQEPQLSRRPTAAQAYSAEDERERMDRRSVPQEKPRKKGAGGLILLALLELAAIAAVALWWVRWLV